MLFRFRCTPVWSFVDASSDPGCVDVCDRLLSVRDSRSRDDVSARLKLWDGLVHYVERDVLLGPDNNRFRTGLMHRLRSRLEKRGHTVEIISDTPLPPMKPVSATCLIGRDMSGDRAYQLESVNAGLEHGRGIWWLATNAGKTSCIAAFALAIKKQLKKRTLVIVPNKTLVHQLSREIAQLLGAVVKVGIAGDGVKQTNVDILVATYQTLHQGVPSDKNQEFNIDLYKFISTCTAIIVDEAHHAGTSRLYQEILDIAHEAVFRIGCTGTVDKTDKSKEKGHVSNDKAIEHRWTMESLLGPVLTRVTNAELVEVGISARPRILLIEDRKAFGPTVMPPPPQIVDGEAVEGGNPYPEMFARAVINDKRFRRSVSFAVETLLSQDKPPFVFSHSVQFLERQALTLKHFNVPFEILHGKYSTHQRDEVLERFKKTAADKRGQFAILSSTIFDEGVSIPAIRGIVLAGVRKAPFELIQRMGRGMRRKEEDNTLTVIDFSMIHCGMLHRHYLTRVATFMDEQFEIQRIGDIESLNQLDL